MFLFLRSEENRSGPLAGSVVPASVPGFPRDGPGTSVSGNKSPAPLFSVHKVLLLSPKEIWEGPRMFFKKCLLKIVQGVVSINLHP